MKIGREYSALHVNPNDIEDYFNIKKICAESLLLSSDRNIKIIRLCNLYGDNFNAPIFLPTIIRDAVKKKNITITINKHSKKNYLNINEAVDIIVKIIDKGENRIYNVAPDKRISLLQIAKKLKEITACKISFKNRGKKINEAKIDISNLKKEFNFKPKSNLIKELDFLVNLYLDNK